MAPNTFISLCILIFSCTVFGDDEYKSSLTFVIDDTYSMSDDIDEVKLGANAIFDTVLRHNASQIKNFILVTFNDDGPEDPGVLVRVNTKDREEFKNALSEINVHGGGDCPEYAMAGIREALEKSLDRSYIYVFTDASAKDYNDFEELKAFAQQKQSQIVFMLTGNCDKPVSSPDNQVFHSMAEATHGQVFNIKKKEVGKVLEYVKRTITGRRTTLVDEKLPPGKHNMTFNVDAIMGEITLSLASSAADDPSVTIRAPDGSDVWKKMLFETDQVQVYSVDATMPGAHTVEVNCKEETQAVISARSGIDFQHGFSAYKLSSLVDTSSTPAPGKSHLSIKLNEGDIELQTVQILDMNDNVKMELPLEVVNKDAKFYSTPAFDPPNTMFKIAIIGYDPKTNSHITRKGPTPMEIFKPPPGKKIDDRVPLISMAGYIRAKFNAPLQVVCRVNSYPPPTIVWKNREKGTLLSGEVSPLILPYVYTSVLSIEKLQENMTYECEARNSVGVDAKQVVITTNVVNKFNVLDTPQRVQIGYEEDGHISCIVDAYPPAHINWFKGGAKLIPNDNIIISGNRSVVTIKHATPSESGRYACVAKNAHKKKIIYRYVTVFGTEKPEIDKDTNDASVNKGSSVALDCRILKGIPKPSITWYHSSGDRSMIEIAEWKERERVMVTIRDKFDAGSYLCEAKNDVGADYHEISLSLKYPPTIAKGETSIDVASGSRVSIPCHADGGPKPHVTWYKDDVEITNSDKVYIFGDQTLRLVVLPSNRGYYTCKATNELGSVNKTVKVDVNVPVSIKLPRESKLLARVGARLILPCEASGDPKPNVRWIYHSFTSAESKSIRTALKMLILNRLQTSHEGYYTCVATNTAGSMNITYEVHVQAPPSILNSRDNRFEVVAGDVARIPCKVSGSPKPRITWMKEDLNLAVGSMYYINEETLIIRNVPRDAAGVYTCKAENLHGSVMGHYELTVLDGPPSSLPTSFVTLAQGRPAEINCTAPHTGIGSLRWYKDGRLIRSGPLTLANPTLRDAGDYTCRISDFFESVSATIRVTVGQKPEFTFSDDDEDLEVAPDSPVSLNCENRGDPTPQVEWYQDGRKLNATEMEYEVPTDIVSPGQYRCIVKNTLGSIAKTFNVAPRDCFINTEEITRYHPLILTSRLNWPILNQIEKYKVLTKGEEFTLVCPTRFTMFPKQHTKALCDGGMNTVLVEGRKYDYSDIQCTEEVKHTIQRGSECMDERNDTETISIGYNIGTENTEVYEICFNKTSETPIYAKQTMSTTPSDDRYVDTWLDSAKFNINLTDTYDCENQIRTISSELGRWFHREDKCCFSRRQLVSPKDVFSGAPQQSTFSYFNVVPHWSTCNTANWDEVEKRVRNFAYDSSSELQVWTGTSNELSLRGNRGVTSRLITDRRGYQQTVSTYLWKMIQDPTTMSSLAIIQVNVPDLSPAEIPEYILCEDQCASLEWMTNPDWHDVRKGYTYCCSIEDFEEAFGFSDLFMPNMTPLLKPDETEFDPESSFII